MKSPGWAVLFAMSLALALCLAVAPVAAHDDDLGGRGSRSATPGSLDGTWRLVAPRLEDGVEEYKFVSAGRFVWYVVAGPRIVRGAEGRALQRGDGYEEWIDSALAEDSAWMVGGHGTFTVRQAAGRWVHQGVVASGGERVTVDEAWERVR